MTKVSRMLGRLSVLAAGAFLVLVLSIPAAMAQPGGGDRGGRGGQRGGDRGGDRGGQRGGDRGGRGNFDPSRFQEMMVTRTLERMELSEDESAAIKPLLAKVYEKQFAARSGMGRGRMMGGPRGGDNQQEDTSPAGQLRKALENKDTSAKDIKAKLDAFRKDRTKKEEELKTARENLRKVLTVRQEAMLVLSGTLD